MDLNPILSCDFFLEIRPCLQKSIPRRFFGYTNLQKSTQTAKVDLKLTFFANNEIFLQKTIYLQKKNLIHFCSSFANCGKKHSPKKKVRKSVN